MKKSFRLLIVVVLALCLLASLFACNKDAEEAANKLRVTNDFVALGLERVNPNYKVEMTDDEILALENPVEYIISKNLMVFFSNALNSTSIRIQKLEKFNQLVLSETSLGMFGDDADRKTHDEIKDSFMLLSEVGWTSEDFADLFYAVIYSMFTNSKELCETTHAELIAIREKVVATNYESAEQYENLMDEFYDAIENLEIYLEMITELIESENNVLETVADAEHSLKTMFGALAKTVLMINSEPFLAIAEKTEFEDDEYDAPVPSFKGTATELSSYIGGIKQNIDEINSSFSKQDIINISNAIVTLEKLLRGLNGVVPGMVVYSQVAAVSSVVVHMLGYSGEFISNGLGVVDTATVQRFIDISNLEYAYVSNSILIAQILQGALGNHDAESLKALLDDYKTSVGTDSYALQKHVIGLIILGSNSLFSEYENDCEYVCGADLDKIIATRLLDIDSAMFTYQRFNLEQQLSKEEVDQDAIRYAKLELEDIAQSIMIAITKITGHTPDMTGFEALSEEWLDKVEELAKTVIAQSSRNLFDKVLNAYKALIDHFFENQFDQINELATFELQTEDGEFIERLYELEDELQLASIFESLLGIFAK